MHSFDWGEYLDFAEAALDSQSEALWRAGISRAYYAAFHAAMNWLETNGAMPEKDSHRDIWRAYYEVLGDDDDVAFQIGEKGMALRDQREQADYNGDVEIGRARLQKSLTLAHEIRRLIQGLPNASPQGRATTL